MITTNLCPHLLLLEVMCNVYRQSCLCLDGLNSTRWCLWGRMTMTMTNMTFINAVFWYIVIIIIVIIMIIIYMIIDLYPYCSVLWRHTTKKIAQQFVVDQVDFSSSSSSSLPPSSPKHHNHHHDP